VLDLISVWICQQKKKGEFGKDIFLPFIDTEKAYHSKNRLEIWVTLHAVDVSKELMEKEKNITTKVRTGCT
jgi:hypothetical protein